LAGGGAARDAALASGGAARSAGDACGGWGVIACCAQSRTRAGAAVSDGFTFHRHFIDMLRVEALRHWQPAPIAVPTTLFLSDERISGLAADYGWGGLCRASP